MSLSDKLLAPASRFADWKGCDVNPSHTIGCEGAGKEAERQIRVTGSQQDRERIYRGTSIVRHVFDKCAGLPVAVRLGHPSKTVTNRMPHTRALRSGSA